jgi:antitoxin component YwqK of YwqJK toxin-antitoxin module
VSPARRIHALSAAIALLAALAGSCRSLPDLSKLDPPPAAQEAEPTGRIENRSEIDDQSGKLTHEWTVLVVPGRGAIKHGQERNWYPGGALHWEREFRYGKPTGVWRSWYENGKPRTECFYFGPEVERTMTFWREDGKLTAQGPACDGARRGAWKFWWSNGQLAEQGEYRGGLREGVWQAWSEDGGRRYERVYEKNVRVSQRELERAAAAALDAAPQ